ncbi:hypothetical protein BUALT_Bualt13G0053600 [Buddleja alternifolia]|uniref:Homeobox domain-containing protein n=1 Tax=Buddleja alternifolia TaxID=168488 RepID=A0AAV6WTG4_9LAMI|nr:hypothetical protein BUALT_Bualt13G0053600 [Buddleja alternifolia]
MAMYYPGSSEIQADGLQTLYLLNPNYVGGYSDTHYMNSAAAHAPNSAPVPHAPPAQQFVGIPLSHDPSRPSPALPQQEDIQAVHNTIPRFHYNNNNIWNLFDQSGNGNQPNMPQGLSLSLSQHQTGFDDKSLPSDHDFRAGLGLISSKISSSSPSNGANSMQSVIMGSKYLEAAQQLLDEVANVGKGSKIDRPEPSKDKSKIIEKLKGEASSGNNGGGAELTTPQRQEIQMKKAKLISMLDEVDQRYKQYHHQMQIIVASFEQAAGIGSAKSYTQLALNTILKQFKCLKSAISAQIKALSKTLGEDDQTLVEGSRLKFVDHHLRQQKAMQQMGMMHNAWRPQRGLPERAVSVLRAWLFEHFLHPYPKDSDKVMLAKQTGLTRSQVSNWFINARVRLWKPMVEEMYLEEMKNQEQISPETTSKTGPRQKESNSKKNNMTPPVIDHLQSKQDNLILNLDPSSTEISPSTITNSPTGSSLQGTQGPGFGTYGIREFSRFNGDQQISPGSFPGNNNFSLTLALPPSETSQRTHHQQNFFSHRNFEFETRIENESNGINNGIESDSHPNIGYEILDFQNRKQFPAQLLPDFVA